LKTQYKFATAILIALVFGSVIGYTIASNGNTFIISQGIYPQAKFTVYSEESTYYIKNEYGLIINSGTNATTIIQYAFDSLTSDRAYKEKVLLKGFFEIDSTIKLPSYITVELQGNITLANNKNINMIETKETTTIHCDWFNGVLNGNHDYQTSGNGMDLDAFSYGTIENVFFTKIKGHALLITSISGETEGNVIKSNTFINIHGSGIKTESNVKDSFISHNKMEQMYSYGISTTGLLTSIIQCNTISAEVQSGISVSSGNDVSVIGNDIDTCGQHGIIIVSCNFMPNTVSNNVIYNNGWHGIVIDDSNNTVVSANAIYSNGYDGINIQGASMFNIISNNIITDDNTPTQDYGIREQDTTDYNIITSNTCLNSVNVGILQIGANSQVNLCFNGTIWIP